MFVAVTGGKPRLILDQDKRTTGGLVQGYVLKVQLQMDKQLNQRWTWIRYRPFYLQYLVYFF